MVESGVLGKSEVPGYNDIGEPLYVKFNGDDAAFQSIEGISPGGLGFEIAVHEIGHLLGLAHPHDGGFAADATLFPGVTTAFGDYGDYDLNQSIWTVMSYNEGWETQFGAPPALTYGYAATPMALDIAVIQAIYGANTTYASGNNTYVLPAINAAGTYWSCIWDTGGTDTITNAGASNSCTINLNAAPLIGPNAGGYVSWNTNIMGGFTIANAVVIEQAIGGNGNDILIGNSAANALLGDAGNDLLNGGDGSRHAEWRCRCGHDARRHGQRHLCGRQCGRRGR